MSASFCSKILLVFLVSLLATVLQCMARAEKEVDGVPQESVVVVGGGVGLADGSKEASLPLHAGVLLHVGLHGGVNTSALTHWRPCVPCQ